MKKTNLSINNLFTYLFLCTLSLNMTSCIVEDNRLITEKQDFVLDLPEFSAITLDFSAKVILQQGETQSIKINAQPEIFEALTKTVTNGEWLIDLANFSGGYEKVTIEITIPTLTQLTTSSTGDIITKGAFEDLDIITLETNSTGDIQFNGDAQEIQVLIDGSGDIDLKGNTEFLVARIESNGDLTAFDMQTTNADIRTTSNGDAAVRVAKTLTVIIESNGDVAYKGYPTITSRISGNGKLRDKN